jgi:predicted O-linked N-acetylglucosamine transferase (SPINDLY family)
MKDKSRFDLGRGGMPFVPKQRLQSRPLNLAPARASEEGSLLTQAVSFHQAGLLEEAEQLYRRILQAQPKNYDCLHMLGIIAFQRRDYAEAVRLIDIVVKHNPKFDAAHNNRGNALKEMKRFDEALASYDRAIVLKPDNFDALNNRGVVLYELRRLEEALASYDRAIALKPAHAEAFSNRGVVLNELRRFNEAIASYDQAIALNRDYADAFNNRGTAFYEAERYEEALASYDRTIALKPDDAEALQNHGNTLSKLKRFDLAVVSYDRAFALKPNLKYLEGHRLYAKMHICDWSNFDDECAHLVAAIQPKRPAMMPFHLLAIPSSVSVHLRCAQMFAADKCPVSVEELWRGERYSHDRIRVAYVSADFRDHAVSHLLANMFEQHDRARFETVAVALGLDDRSAMRARLRSVFGQFIDAGGKSDEDVARVMRELEVDIAVDLMGFTSGARPAIMAYRPAPIQVNYLSYPGIVGTKYIDYILADRFVIPEEERAQFSEPVVYLPDAYLGYDIKRKISERTPTRAELGLPERGFVFCAFNNSYKLTPSIFDIWVRLLHAVESSVLWLTGTNATAMNNLRREAQARGVDPERLVFAPFVKRIEDHLARHRVADLFLDTLPFNAQTTACDALWAELPVVTCLGPTFVGRVAASVLNAVGLPELITYSLDEYEALALKLARDPALLAALKQKLARQRTSYPLFNTERFTRHMEAAYTTMWERHQRGESPQSFAVAPMA